LEHYLGGHNFKGVPLLDRSVDWNWFTNWPDEFKFRGRAYSLRLVDTSGGDLWVGLKSRAAVRSGTAIFALYRPTTTNGLTCLSISASWRSDGTLYERAVRFGDQNVFTYQFYPSGHLYLWMRDDVRTEDQVIEYFAPDGALVGTQRSADGEKVPRRTWLGRAIDEDAFDQRTLDLYRKSSQ